MLVLTSGVVVAAARGGTPRSDRGRNVVVGGEGGGKGGGAPPCLPNRRADARVQPGRGAQRGAGGNPRTDWQVPRGRGSRVGDCAHRGGGEHRGRSGPPHGALAMAEGALPRAGRAAAQATKWT